MGRVADRPRSLSATNPWPLIDGWLRVEYKNAGGIWIGATQTWLSFGFAAESRFRRFRWVAITYIATLFLFSSRLRVIGTSTMWMNAADGPQDLLYSTVIRSSAGIRSTSTIRGRGFPRHHPAGRYAVLCQRDHERGRT